MAREASLPHSRVQSCADQVRYVYNTLQIYLKAPPAESLTPLPHKLTRDQDRSGGQHVVTSGLGGKGKPAVLARVGSLAPPPPLGGNADVALLCQTLKQEEGSSRASTSPTKPRDSVTGLQGCAKDSAPPSRAPGSPRAPHRAPPAGSDAWSSALAVRAAGAGSTESARRWARRSGGRR